MTSTQLFEELTIN